MREANKNKYISKYLKPIMNERFLTNYPSKNPAHFRMRLKKRRDYIYGR